MLLKKSAFLCSLFALTATAALAQHPPTAGQLLQQAEQPPKLPSADAPPTVLQEQPTVTAAQGARFMLRAVRFSGNQVYNDQQLLALVEDGMGKALNLTELDALVQRITDHYRKHGYLVARAYLPPQEIKDGVVIVAVLEGRVGQVVANNPAGVSGGALAPLARVRSGDPVRNEALEGALLRLADLPGVKVKSTLRPGEAVGTSDFLVEVEPGRAVSGAVDIDNFGNRYTAAGRVGTSLAWNNPAGLGDQLSLRAQTGGARYNYGRVGYQLPLGSYATRIGVAWSQMDYKLGKDFASLSASGDASVGSLYLMHPILRSRRNSWFFTLQYDDKSLRDRVESTATEIDKRLHNWSAGLVSHFRDDLGGGGSNSVNLIYTAGDLSLDATSVQTDALSARSDGTFAKWSASWQRLQRLPAGWLLSMSLNGQWSNKNLDSSEKMILGGSSGVRAYPQGEAIGDRGYLLNLELRHALGRGWEAFGFYDQGRVTINSNPWNESDNRRRLAGYGLGAGYATGAFSLRAYAAWKGDTGEPTSDVDRIPRIWAQGVYQF